MAQHTGIKGRGPWFLLGILLLPVCTAESVGGDGNQEKAAEEAARKVWAVTDLVLDKHFAAPSRQEMLLAALRSVAAPGPSKADLSRKVSEVVTPDQFAALLRECWPVTKQGVPADEKSLSEFLAREVLRAVSGSPGLVPADQHKVMEQLNQNRYVGTGIQIRWNAKEELAEIVVLFPGGPAHKAGARAGDLIVEVDGVSVAKMPLGKVVDLLRGEEGSAVTVAVRQAGSTEKRLLRMTRGVVPIPTLAGYKRLGEEAWDYRAENDTPVAYVRVLRLTSSAVHELRQLERRLLADGYKALILDLRFTTGADLSQGVMTADSLLDGGLICRVRDREGRVKEYQADRDCLFRGWPMAVLIGPGTRGPGPETLAGALRDRRRAVLLGEATSGDLYAVATFALPHDLGYVSLRTGIVERSPQAPAKPVPPDPEVPGRHPEIGIRPDHVVATGDQLRQAIAVWQVAQERPNPSEKEKPPADPVLRRAVEHLREVLKTAK